MQCCSRCTQHCIEILSSRCCQNTSETTFHKKITCAMLAQSIQSIFFQENKLCIRSSLDLTWPKLHKKITCAMLAHSPQKNSLKKIICNFVWIYLGQHCTRKLLCNVGRWVADNFYEENKQYNIGLTRLVQSQVTKMKLKAKYYA